MSVPNIPYGEFHTGTDLAICAECGRSCVVDDGMNVCPVHRPIRPPWPEVYVIRNGVVHTWGKGE